MSGLRVRAYEPPDRAPIIRLWDRCGLIRPSNDPGRDIDRKLVADPDGFLVGIDTASGRVVTTVMAGYDGHRGWINYLAVDPDRRGLGHGREIMRCAERLLDERGCPKINLQVRTSNVDTVRFYERIGYVLDDVVSMGRRLADDGGDPRSSESSGPDV